VLCRELTKTHEEIRRGGLGDLAAGIAGGSGGPVLGEITLVVAGAAGDEAHGTVAEAAAEVARREQAGVSRRDAVAAVAAERGLRRREVYNAVVQPGLPAPP
jgi:16S rRNA (cytidine1402-2'-O)-methyltransferase